MSKIQSEFAALVTDVKPLRTDRVNVYQQRSPKARNPPSPAQDFDNIRLEQSNQAASTFFDPGMSLKLQRKIRRGLISPQARLDLHGYKQDTLLAELAQFFSTAQRAGHQMVLIIHGKGNHSRHSAVLKPLVHQWLEQSGCALAWCPASPQNGGDGASFVYLRRSA